MLMIVRRYNNRFDGRVLEVLLLVDFDGLVVLLNVDNIPGRWRLETVCARTVLELRRGEETGG